MYLHFHNTCDHQIWQASTYRGFNLNETNADAGDVITLRSHDKLKTYFDYQSAYSYSHQTWQNGNLRWLAPAYKVK